MTSLNRGTNCHAFDNRRTKGALNSKRVANMGFTPAPDYEPTATWFMDRWRKYVADHKPVTALAIRPPMSIMLYQPPARALVLVQ